MATDVNLETSCASIRPLQPSPPPANATYARKAIPVMRGRAARTLGRALLAAIFAPVAAFGTESIAVSRPIELNDVTLSDAPASATAEGRAYILTTTGHDPYVVFPFPDRADKDRHPILEMEYFSATGIDALETRLLENGHWSAPVPAARIPIAEGPSSAALPILDAMSTYIADRADRSPAATSVPPPRPTHVRIDLGMHPGKELQVRSIVLRSRSEPERRAVAQRRAAGFAKQAAAARIRRYQDRKTYPAAITRIAVCDEKIQIEGQISGDTPGPYFLRELRLHEASWHVPATTAPLVQLCAAEDDATHRSFSMTLPRYTDRTDRLTCRWQIVQRADTQPEPTLLSAARWATDLPDSGNLPAPPELRNAKGLNGIASRFGLQELNELGVRHIVVNVIVTDLIHREREASRREFRYAAQRWWVDAHRLAEVDRQVRFAAEHDIVVAMIILLPVASSDILVHPEAHSAGVYAMPNLGVSDAAEKYSAAIRFLAHRYSGTAGFGRVDHWIAHNEVDFAWQWTNMGEQPLALMMEHYHRSMRILSLHARDWNPHAEVFVSLTHHFEPEHTDWKTYSAKSILDSLAMYTAVEGDFPWGVAHHPYPPSLFHPLRWPEEQVRADFATPMITMKNLKVLKDFLSQPRFLTAAGELRTVLLSEQGYHADPARPSEEERQSRALRFAWDRMRELNFVSAFDYHRWVDHPDEGGLLLGLRTLPQPSLPAGRKKLAWQTFADINTDREAAERVPAASAPR